MSKQILEIKSQSSVQTEQVAEQLGRNLKGGEVIELVSDLGGGKTTFTRGLVRGLGSADRVSSPTFKISNEYQGKNLRIYHFDFYRLNEAGIVADELAEVLGEPNSVIVVEWADIVQNVLPDDRLTINLTSPTENERVLKFEFPKKMSYLTKGVIPAKAGIQNKKINWISDQVRNDKRLC